MKQDNQKWLGFALAAVLGVSGTAAAEETQKDIADRIARAGEKAKNAGDAKSVKDARDAAQSARDAKSMKDARSIERDFNGGGNGDAAK